MNICRLWILRPHLLDAYRAGAVCMVNSFRSKIVHKKAIFAVLTNEKYAHLFNEEELEAIKKHVPWTRKFRDEQTEHYGEKINLVEWTRTNQIKLVLKTERRLRRSRHLYRLGFDR